MEVIKISKSAARKAISVIENGGVVVFPTDTVYGFLADATNNNAVSKIFKIKSRKKSKPLSVFVADIKEAKLIAEIDNCQEKTINNKWPGKFTFILKIKRSSESGSLSKLAKGKNETIAIRVPKYNYLNLLLKKIKKPIAQTSVNISGEKELNKINDIILKFALLKVKPDLIIDGGPLRKSKPSKIIDLTKEKKKIVRK